MGARIDAVALQPGDRLLRSGCNGPRRPAGIRAAKCAAYDDLDKFGPFQDEWLRGGPVRAAGCRRATRTSRSTPSRPAAAPACRSRASTSTTSASTTRPSATRCRTTVLPEGRRLARDRPERPAPPAPGDRAPRAASRRHLLHGRPRSALGDQADQDGRDGDDGALQAPRHRSGADAAEGARHHQVPVHHAQAARGAVRAHLAEEGRHHRRVLRRHRDDAAVPSLRGRGADGRRVLRADLRQHADGPGRPQAARARKTTGRSSITRPRRAR